MSVPSCENAALPCSRSPVVTPRTQWPSMAYSKSGIQTRSTTGSTFTKPKAWPVCWPISRAAITEAVFDEHRKEELTQRLRQAPDEAARKEMDLPEGVLPGRWQLRTIRATIAWLDDYTLSGVWRVLKRFGLARRTGLVQHYSPDPAYAEKEAHLHACLREAARWPAEVVFVFLDEMGYYRWPDAAVDWGPCAPATAPVADRAASKQKQWRLIGALNALTGQVDYLDGYIVGRAKVMAFYEQLAAVYAGARRIYVCQDNWSIHKHPEVNAALATWPQIEPVWLPTYAPWLNPIEKLWRFLREQVLKLHRLAGQWELLRGSVNGFLDQFEAGSEPLLRYVGLLGEGKLAQVIRSP